MVNGASSEGSSSDNSKYCQTPCSLYSDEEPLHETSGIILTLAVHQHFVSHTAYAT